MTALALAACGRTEFGYTQSDADAGLADCTAIVCDVPMSCDPETGACDCFGRTCGVGSTCSGVVQGCTEIAPVCDGRNQVVLFPRDLALPPVIKEVFSGHFIMAPSCYRGPVRYRILEGALPPGITMETTAYLAIGGTPSADAVLERTYRFKLGVHDFGNNTDDASYYSIKVVTLEEGFGIADGG